MYRFFFTIALVLAPIRLVASEVKTYGQPLPAGTAINIATALQNSEQYLDKPILFEGRIGKVCQKKGCWLMIESDGKAARVKTKGHAYFVDKDSQGSARVFGTLSQVKVSKKMQKHLAKDAGQSIAKQPISKPSNLEYQIIADGIEVL